jgi:cytochrome b561
MLKNSEEKYGFVSKSIHWIIAGLFVYLFYLALTMIGMEDSADKWAMYAQHKQFGVLVGILVLFRVLWKLSNTSLNYPQKDAIWKKRLASLTHVFLYGIMIMFPVSGYMMSMGGSHGVVFFGIEVVDIIGESKLAGEWGHTIHGVLEYATYAVVGLHVVGALYHHFIEKDNVMTRMLPFSK